LKSVKNGRSAKNAYIMTLGYRGSGKSSTVSDKIFKPFYRFA